MRPAARPAERIKFDFQLGANPSKLSSTSRQIGIPLILLTQYLVSPMVVRILIQRYILQIQRVELRDES